MASDPNDRVPSDSGLEPLRAKPIAPSHDRRTRSYDSLHRTEHRGRLVRIAKYGLPALAVLLLGVAAAWSTLFGGPKPGSPRVTLHDAEGLPPGNDVRMVGPRYAGTDSRGRPFLITAERAQQDAANKDLVHLYDLQADLTFEGNVWLSALAPRGLYDTEKQVLNLDGGADVYSNKGYELHAPQIRLDMRNDLAEGMNGIEGHGPLGHMRANQYRFQQREKHLTLTGDVRVTYNQGVSP